MHACVVHTPAALHVTPSTVAPNVNTHEDKENGRCGRAERKTRDLDYVH